MILTVTSSPSDKNSLRFIELFVFFVIIFALTLFCLSLKHDTLEQVVPLWLPTALLIAWLFHYPPRQWLSPLAVAAASIFLAGYLLYGFSWMSLLYMTFDLLEASVAAYLLRRVLNAEQPLENIRSWIKFILYGVILVPLLTSILFAATSLASSTFWQSFAIWFIADATSILSLTPIGLLYKRRTWSLNRETFIPQAEHALTLLITMAISYIVVAKSPFPFSIIIVTLMWTAIRLPLFNAMNIFFWTAMCAFLSFHFQHVLPQPHHDTLGTGNLLIYLPILLILLPSQAMAITMHQLRTDKVRIAESENRFRNAMEYSAIGMALASPSGKWLQVNHSLCQLLRYPPELLTKMTIQDVTYNDDKYKDVEQLHNLLAGDISSYTLEKRFLCRGGEIIWTLFALSLVRDAEQNPLYFIAQIEDISHLKRTEMANERLVERMTLANDAGGIGIWEWNLTENSLNWDKRMLILYERRHTDMPTFADWLTHIYEPDREHFQHEILTAIEQKKQPFLLEFRTFSRRGTLRHMRIHANLICSPAGEVLRMLGICIDMTELKTLAEDLHQEKERLHITLDAIDEAVICTDRDMKITFMNPVAERMCGWSLDMALGIPIQSVVLLTEGVDGEEINNLIQTRLQEGVGRSINLQSTLVLHGRQGQRIDVQESVASLKMLDGTLVGAVLVLRDVSETRSLLQELSHSASHDPLTGLPNRANFHKCLKEARLTSSEQDDPQQYVLAFLDLDYFKAVNDSAGHAAGDQLLKELAVLMQQQLRPDDVIARLGGDEFGILMPDCSVARATVIIQKLINIISDYTFRWAGKRYQVGASVGLTLLDEHNWHNTDNEILAQADLACYTSKHQGRGRICVYDTPQHERDNTINFPLATQRVK